MSAHLHLKVSGRTLKGKRKWVRANLAKLVATHMTILAKLVAIDLT